MSRTPPTKSGKDFIPCPEGAHNAVVVDVSEAFETPGFGGEGTTWKRTLVWQVEETMPDSVQRFVVSARYTDSQHPKSKLRPVMVSLLGRDLTPDEEENGVEMESLVGRPCLIQVVHNHVMKDGTENTYANVTGVLPLPRKMQPLEFDNGWTRWKDRKADEPLPEWYKKAKWRPKQTALPSPDDPFNSAQPGPDDDIPF